MENNEMQTDLCEMRHLKKRRLFKEVRAVTSHVNYEEEVQFVKKRYILESFLRDDNSAVVMKSKIQESFDAFKENYISDNHFHKSTVKRLVLQPEKIQDLPEKELFASLPVLLDHFQQPALLTLSKVVTGKTYIRRNHLIKYIQLGLPKLFARTGQDASECLQNVKNILRNPDSYLPPCAAVLPEKPSSALAVAKCTLGQLENLPNHTLYSMNRIIGGESLTIKLELRKIGSSKASLAECIKNKADRLLEGVRDFDPLPELLKKALLVASLSARQSCGEDGGIVENLGYISPELNALHNDFLKAISHVQKLDSVELKDIYGCLSSDDLFLSKSLRLLRRIIRTFLVEWLFECYDEIIPESVIRTINMINKLGAAKGAVKERGRKGIVKGRDQKGAAKERESKGTVKERVQKDTVMERDPKATIKERDPIGYKTEPRVDTKLRLDRELECVLNVSTHLQQVIYERTENAGLEQRIAEIPLDSSEDECEPWFSENSYDTHELDGKEETYVGESFSEPEFIEVKEHGLQEQMKEDFPHGELKNSSRVDSLSKNNSQTEETVREIVQQIQEVCDEASLFCYRLVGSMIDEFLRIQGHVLEAPARTYLRNGFPCTAERTGEIGPSDIQQSMDITILLDTAKKLYPEMPTSVIEKIKLSLGVT
ncbi:uncharacterized protein LOC131053387 isoform X2 [Cryptomeria japonica]|uniref:uncharacterized protein LOC131053387 isoform X2 n=1 Tax=Cryptomeria japonica TaxID=3369 RepID=UPI0027D9F642|nr:uncharacterized protein LOC131053387 isoform X2 [Cryptomeria japonica]